MIRASARTGDGRTLIILGVSDKNVARLTSGHPIFVAGETVGVPGQDIVIFHGRTEYEMTEGLATLIGPKTEIRRVRPEELPPGHPDWEPRDG